MAISTDTSRQTTHRVLDVRIPNRAAGDLATEAERRLSRADGVTNLTVHGIQALEPGLSATVVTVAVTVESTAGSPEFGDFVGVEPG